MPATSFYTRSGRWAAGCALIALGALSLAQTAGERRLYGALPAGAALVFLGLTAWRHGRDVRARPSFEWRGIVYRGRAVAPFAWGFMAGGAAFVLMGLACVGLWLR